MTNFNAKINLMKLKRAGVMQIQGRGEVLRCLVIPIEENHLFVSTDDMTNKAKAVYLDLSAWELRNPKYEETHMIKQSLPKDVRERMSDEERRAMPILGGLKPVNNDALNAAASCDAPFAQVSDLNDLPF